MLKGVNKRVVEVVDIENEYFEKAILFLRAGRPDSDENTLRQRAGAKMSQAVDTILRRVVQE